MEIHVQKCQNCSSDKMKNILFREPGRLDRVYVQCYGCKAFVASYAINPLGYYHHGKGYESFLRGVTRSGQFMSGREVQRLYERRKREEVERFEKVIRLLEERDKADPSNR